MAYNRIYRTSHTTQLSIKGQLKSRSKIRSAFRHNSRTGKEGAGAHIDKRRADLNCDLLNGNGSSDIYLDVINRVTGKDYSAEDLPDTTTDEIRYADGKKLRKGKTPENSAVLAFEVEARYPGDMIWSTIDESGNVTAIPKYTSITEIEAAPYGEEVRAGDTVIGIGKGYFLYPLDMQEYINWVSATINYLKTRFGENNVYEAHSHMDEGTPHIHAIIAPFVPDKDGIERLSYRSLIGGRSGLFEIQNSYAEAISHLGYKRGERCSSHSYDISTKQYKAGLNYHVNAEYPDNIDDARKEIRGLRADNYELTVKYEEAQKSRTTIQKLRIKNHDLTEENKALSANLEQLNQKLIQLQNQLYMEEIKKCIREKGLELFPNQEAVDIVRKLDIEFIDLGTDFFKKQGYDVDSLLSDRDVPDTAIQCHHDLTDEMAWSEEEIGD